MSEEKEYTIRIGPLLRKVLDKQKEIVEKFTYSAVNPSDYEIGELLAKKIIAGKIIEKGIKIE
jgi:hypothetical protein